MIIFMCVIGVKVILTSKISGFSSPMKPDIYGKERKRCEKAFELNDKPNFCYRSFRRCRESFR